MERGRPAREGVPLIKYEFSDKLRADIIRPSFSVKKIVTELKDGQWPSLQSVHCIYIFGRMKFDLRKSQHGNIIYFFVVRHSYCETTVKPRCACFTTLSGGHCPPHSPPAREITSPLTPEMPPSAVLLFFKSKCCRRGYFIHTTC